MDLIDLELTQRTRVSGSVAVDDYPHNEGFGLSSC